MTKEFNSSPVRQLFFFLVRVLPQEILPGSFGISNALLGFKFELIWIFLVSKTLSNFEGHIS